MGIFDFFKNKTDNTNILGREVNLSNLNLISEGDSALNNNNFSTAIQKYTEAISKDQSNHYSYMKRGKCFQMINEYEKAIKDLLFSIKIKSEFENNQTLAECYLFTSKFIEAIKHFEFAINEIEDIQRIDSNNMSGKDYAATKARAYNNLSVCYFKTNELEKAIESTTKGINSNPNYPNNYGLRGVIYLQKGDVSKAKNDLQKAANLGDARSQVILNQI